ncbi:ABC transporter family substrate-binding protein [Pseudarthrobacter niigatensis]|uniref:Peptide/nickel transport system substrate-binding protein n=1 Tax=Pseudarthrobacter niigatensis TaxID=369935 RepID=A0AAJ1WEC0_9MICC|nr:ABC transporter family substrate-binding protein [Pseudarthrobacter niigatensis]MDQ0144822.1 peptide/nickel transport system substrate-binding protein [Pseudarthrobacter niigatensis]MDQ0264259.1 peptide/nickel transport system substrate-binding protein [Pseudarthrobacter niigatensis]
MPVRRLMQLLTAALAAALVLSGCSGGSAPSVVVGEAKRGGSVTVAEVNAFSSFNPYSAGGNTDINSKIGAITHSGFYYLDDSSKVVRNDKFGHFEKVSDQPLKVKYTVNEGVKWSDGAPIGAADLLLAWAAGSGYFDDVDPVAGKGTKYFSVASDTTGLAGTLFPDIGSDGRSITIVYAAPYADWEVAFDVGLPAHVVAAKSGLNDEKDLVNLLKDTPRGNPEKPASNPALKKVSDFWNTGFDAKSIPDDPALYLSSGPYIVRDIVPGVSMKLVRNRDYVWGAEPWLDEINVRFTGAVPAAVDALRSGQADIISPQPSASTDSLLSGLSSQGITVQRYKQSAYDHLDLNFTGTFSDKDVREAFLKTVPRQAIVDAVVGTQDTKPLDSQVFLPGQPKYDDTVRNNGSADYAKVDIDGAKKLLKGASPSIRILYNRDNPNRARAFGLIRDSAALAGFKVVDGGLASADWPAALSRGGFEAALSGWIGTEVGVSRVPQIFRTGAGSNFTGYSDGDADKIMEQLAATTDLGKQDELLAEIDKHVWEDAYGLPLYQTLGTTAFSSRVAGVKTSPGPLGVWWNVWDWRLSQ